MQEKTGSLPLEELLNEIEDGIRAGDKTLKREIEEALARAKNRKGITAPVMVRDVEVTIAAVKANATLHLNERVLRTLNRIGHRGKPYIIQAKYRDHLATESTTLQGNLSKLYTQDAVICSAHEFIEALLQYPTWMPQEKGVAVNAAMEPVYFGSKKTHLTAQLRNGVVRIAAADKTRYSILDHKWHKGWIMVYQG